MSLPVRVSVRVSCCLGSPVHGLCDFGTLYGSHRPPRPLRGCPATTPAAGGRSRTRRKPQGQPRPPAALPLRLPAAAAAPAGVLPAQVLPRRLPRCRCVSRQFGHRSQRAAGALAPLRLAPRRVGCTRTPPLRPPALPALSCCC